MKLFENKVGRPSNEIIMKRRTYRLVVTALIVAIIGSFAVAISDIKTGSLKGETANATTNTTVTTTSSSDVTVSYSNSNTVNVSKTGTQKIIANIINKSDKKYYYRIFYSTNGKITSKSNCTT